MKIDRNRFVIGKDPNTKDWFIWDDVTQSYICFCDSEQEAQSFVNNIDLCEWVRRFL